MALGATGCGRHVSLISKDMGEIIGQSSQAHFGAFLGSPASEDSEESEDREDSDPRRSSGRQGSRLPPGLFGMSLPREQGRREGGRKVNASSGSPLLTYLGRSLPTSALPRGGDHKGDHLSQAHCLEIQVSSRRW